MTYGDSVPQNGHTSFCLPGSHSACAPHAGQACFWRAAICSDMLAWLFDVVTGSRYSAM